MEWFDSGWGLSLVVFLPLVAGVIIAMIPRTNETAVKWTALIVTGATFALAVVLAARFDYGEKQARDAVDVIGGTIFGGDLDITHPLGFGYSRREIALHKNTKEIMARPINPYATVIVYGTPPVLSGYASSANQDALSDTAALIAERRANGSIILFADDPNFRAIYYGANKLFLNALFFSKAFEPPPLP